MIAPNDCWLFLVIQPNLSNNMTAGMQIMLETHRLLRHSPSADQAPASVP